MHVLHTYSPQFNSHITLAKGMEQLTASYQSALKAYIEKFPDTDPKPPLRLCCISASIYGGALANKEYQSAPWNPGHIEPSVSIACVAKAIAQFKSDNPSVTLPPIDLFFWESQADSFKTEVQKDTATVEDIKLSAHSSASVSEALPIDRIESALTNPTHRREIIMGLYQTSKHDSQWYRDNVVCNLLNLPEGSANTISGKCLAEKTIAENVSGFFGTLNSKYKSNEYITELDKKFKPIPNYNSNGPDGRQHHGPDHGRAVMELVPHIIDGYDNLAQHEFDQLKFEEIKKQKNLGIIEIATGLHDIARTTHGIDTDEYINSPLTYIRLRKAGASHAEATLYTFAAANKSSTDCRGYHEDVGALLSSLQVGEKQALATKVGWNGSSPNLDEYLTTYFKLVCRTVGDADTLEIMRCRANFNCKYYDFFREDEGKAKQLITTAAKHLKDGWPGYDTKPTKKRNALTISTINGINIISP